MLALETEKNNTFSRLEARKRWKRFWLVWGSGGRILERGRWKFESKCQHQQSSKRNEELVSVENRLLMTMNVSEHMGWVRNVVLMNVYFGSGKPHRVEISGRGGQMGRWGKCRDQLMSNPRKRWTDPVTARRVPSKWKREQGEQGEQGDNRVHNLSILCI
jgi:hypothetical protein